MRRLHCCFAKESRYWWFSGKESVCQCRRCRFDPWVERSPGEENGNLFQYSCLGNSMDRGAWWATVHRIMESDTTQPPKQQFTNNISSVWGKIHSRFSMASAVTCSPTLSYSWLHLLIMISSGPLCYKYISATCANFSEKASLTLKGFLSFQITSFTSR